jgi:signal transduction histidine kinase
MTRRLIATIIAIVLATLLVAGGGTLVLANVRARHNTELQLRAQAVELAANIAEFVAADGAPLNENQTRQRLRRLQSFGKLLNIDDVSVLVVNKRGELVGDTLPSGIGAALLDPARIASEGVVSGNVGNKVYAAASADLTIGQAVVVVSRGANAALGPSVRLFLLASIVTLAAAAAVAIAVGRRLTRPVRQASAATQRVAAGELDTRLPTPPDSDHDEMAELARSINAMAASLERSRALEQQFLLSVSHDLRTPLTSIRGYAEAITDGAADPQQSATVIRNEANRLERLVGDLLDLAKLQTKGFSLTVEPIDLGLRAQTDTSSFAPAAEARNITVRCIAEAPVRVLADSDRTSQVIANLIDNALRFARHSVVVTVKQVGAHGVLVVDDDGPGIADVDLPYVFERLYVARSQPVRRENSSGLGLAIVKDLTEAMGGRVLAGSTETGGARFSVYLPLAPAPA